jgi:uncharacterized protein
MDAIIGTKGKRVSKREFNIISNRNVFVDMSDGVHINVDVFRPDGEGKFPALIGMSPLLKDYQHDHVWPAPARTQRIRGTPIANMEAGPTDFFVRRGYVHIIGNVRGTGLSEGSYRYFDSREIKDTYELIEWAANQPWCNGNVSMLGIAVFAEHQLAVAALQPPQLKCIAPLFAWGWDDYRYYWWPGGILSAGFLRWYCSLVNLDVHTENSVLLEELGETGFKEAIARAKENLDISVEPTLVDALKNPDAPGNKAFLDILLHPTDCPYWHSRQMLDFAAIKIPVYIGVSNHQPGGLYHLSDLKVPKKVVSCPPSYVDRPFYQYSWELLRWYDYWLKGIDTGIMDEPPVRLFVTGSNEWLTADEWPLPNTIWIPFNLHENRSLCELEPWPEAESASYDDSPSNRGSLKYCTAPLVENTEIVGPIVLNLYASCRGTDMNFFVGLWDVEPGGKETCLTRGLLKASHRKLDPSGSKPWHPVHTHTDPKNLVPGRVYQFSIRMSPIAHFFKAGHQIALKISGADDVPETAAQVGTNHLCCQAQNTVTVYHNAEYPSHLLLPITKGNIIGTYASGGIISGVEKFMQLK